MERGCGTRKPGGAYLCCGLSENGQPIEHFIIDPPLVMDFDAMGVTPVGVKFVQAASGVWHVFDWVGSEHYPNCADFVEEARRFGISRRIARTAEFAKITPESQIFLVHARGWVDNTADYGDWDCPRDAEDPPRLSRPDHRPEILGEDQREGFCCAGVWWEDIEGGVPADMDGLGITERTVARHMPAFAYSGRRAPEGVKARYQPAVFMRFPILNIQVVASEDGSHEETLKAARKSAIEVRLEEE